LPGAKGVRPMVEGFGEIMTLAETAKYLKLENLLFINYKMEKEDKIPVYERAV
jgi:hypothetical protein